MGKLEWNVILPHGDKYTFNVFNSVRFRSYLMDLKARHKKDPNTNIKEEIRCGLMYSFWAKAEYEIMVQGLFEYESIKIDVYEQVKQNLDQFCEYVLANWESIPAKTYRQQRRK